MTQLQKIMAALAAILVLPKLLGKSNSQVTQVGNLGAFLQTIQYAEGTYNQPNPYAVTFAYSHTIQNFSDHPAITGEWNGHPLSDTYCIAAGFSPGCKSTAAGAYQFLKGTWQSVKNSIGNVGFGAVGQDAGAKELIRRRGALADVEAGRFQTAIYKCNKEWASLPGSPYGQPTKSMEQLENFYRSKGGAFAGIFA